jgi:hypothetical protein
MHNVYAHALNAYVHKTPLRHADNLRRLLWFVFFLITSKKAFSYLSDAYNSDL